MDRAKGQAKDISNERRDPMNKDILRTINTTKRQFSGSASRLVECTTDEFSVISPLSNMPDYGSITVRYVPQDKLIELQSLRQYLTNYRDEKYLFEDAVQEILGDLVEVVQPEEIEVDGELNARGGMTLAVSAEYSLTGDESGDLR